MDRTERFYLIERLLRERKVVRRAEFLKELGVSLATFKRDLEYMRDRLHAPIAWSAQKQGYELVATEGTGPAFELPGLWFNESELHALMTMQQLLADVEPGILGPQIEPLRTRLEALLNRGDAAAVELRRRVRVLRQAGRRLPRAVFEAVASGVLRRQRVRITYDARSTGERSERVVSPQRLVLYRDNWYLDAWCHMRDDLRTFAVDAIARATTLTDAAEEIDDETLDRRLGSGYGIFSGEDVQWAALRFTPGRARWVAHEQWHPLQRGTFERDGSYVLEVPFSDPRELMMDVLKYGADVRVDAPEALVKLHADEVARMARSAGATGSSEP